MVYRISCLDFYEDYSIKEYSTYLQETAIITDLAIITNLPINQNTLVSPVFTKTEI